MTTHTPESSAPLPRAYIKKGEAAAYLKCTVRCIENMIVDGRLKAYKLGPRFLRLDRNEIDEAMARING
jgi:excisionase family DNA binding protein